MKSYKRDRFRTHKCERLSNQERAMLLKAIELNKLDENGSDSGQIHGLNKHGTLLD
jgi:hypothetical protein